MWDQAQQVKMVLRQAAAMPFWGLTSHHQAVLNAPTCAHLSVILLPLALQAKLSGKAGDADPKIHWQAL